jgi:hypothetical protein
MAPITYNIGDVAIKEGATFVFGSWTCIKDGMGGFSRHLAHSAGPLPNLVTSFEVPHDLIDNLDNLEIADPNTTQVYIAESELVSEPSETHLPGVTFGLHSSARIIRAEQDSSSTKNLPVDGNTSGVTVQS